MRPSLGKRIRSFLLPRKRGKPATVEPWDLSAPLLHWSHSDPWTLGHAVEGTVVFGQTGGGKSSASGAAIARALLALRAGGLVLVAKRDERAAWEGYCRDTGRSGDLIVFAPESPWRFNFLDYPLHRGGGSGLTENLVNLFSTVLEVAERSGGGSSGGHGDEQYWRLARRQLTRNAIDLSVLATGRASVPQLYRLVISAPTSNEQVKSEAWRKQSFCYHCLVEADTRPKSPSQQTDLGLVTDYWLNEYPNLSDRTRSVVVSTFTSLIDVLNRGILRELFCTQTNITPEVTLDGKILLIDLPVKEYLEVGVLAALLWKLAFQRFSEQRDLSQDRRPLFLWADECHHWLTSQDALYQTTCRSSRVATVLLTQNLGCIESALGGSEKGKTEAAALLGNCNLKVLHANGDPSTNAWASTLIGRTLQHFPNGSVSQQADDWITSAMGMHSGGQTSGGFNSTYELDVQPSVFSELRTGGPANGMRVDAILFQSGRRFQASGRNWLHVTFEQQPSR